MEFQGRNICETPNELLETLGIENNHTMRVCRGDDPAQRSRLQQQQQYSSSNNAYTQPQQQYTYPQYQQQGYSNYPTNYDQQVQQYISSSPR